MNYNLRTITARPDLVRAEIEAVGVDPAGYDVLTPKGEQYVLRASGLKSPAVAILKQELLARGGDAATNKGVLTCAVERSDVLIFANARQLRALANGLKGQPFGLPELGEQIKSLLDGLHRAFAPLSLGEYSLPLGERTLVMGILNLTTDSFSGDGLGADVEATLQQARGFAAGGCDILDLGAESTRPGSAGITADAELASLLPVIVALRDPDRGVRLPLSIDSSKAVVADQCLALGAQMINDISGLRGDPAMAAVAAKWQRPTCVMHIKGVPRTMQVQPTYDDLLGEVIAYLRESVELAVAAGLARELVIVDPGIGFGKNFDHNLELLRRLPELHSLGQPLLVGTSRKRFIGHLLGDLPPEQRTWGTAATVAASVAGGAHIVRVHDVAEMVQVVRVADAIRRGWVAA